jgi:hypothetical protein
LIAFISLVVSIVFGCIGAAGTFLAIKASAKANELQDQILRVEQRRDVLEVRTGEVLLISVLGRYFIVLQNRYELTGKAKTDELSFHQYLSGLIAINRFLGNLSENPFYIKLLEKYPYHMNMIGVQLPRVIVQMKVTNKIVVNPQLHSLISEFYDNVKSEIEGQDVLGDKFYQEIDKAKEFFRQEFQEEIAKSMQT